MLHSNQKKYCLNKEEVKKTRTNSENNERVQKNYLFHRTQKASILILFLFFYIQCLNFHVKAKANNKNSLTWAKTHKFKQTRKNSRRPRFHCELSMHKPIIFLLNFCTDDSRSMCGEFLRHFLWFQAMVKGLILLYQAITFNTFTLNKDLIKYF